MRASGGADMHPPYKHAEINALYVRKMGGPNSQTKAAIVGYPKAHTLPTYVIICGQRFRVHTYIPDPNAQNASSSGTQRGTAPIPPDVATVVKATPEMNAAIHKSLSVQIAGAHIARPTGNAPNTGW